MRKPTNREKIIAIVVVFIVICAVMIVLWEPWAVSGPGNGNPVENSIEVQSIEYISNDSALMVLGEAESYYSLSMEDIVINIHEENVMVGRLSFNSTQSESNMLFESFGDFNRTIRATYIDTSPYRDVSANDTLQLMFLRPGASYKLAFFHFPEDEIIDEITFEMP